MCSKISEPCVNYVKTCKSQVNNNATTRLSLRESKLIVNATSTAGPQPGKPQCTAFSVKGASQNPLQRETVLKPNDWTAINKELTEQAASSLLTEHFDSQLRGHFVSQPQTLSTHVWHITGSLQSSVPRQTFPEQTRVWCGCVWVTWLHSMLFTLSKSLACIMSTRSLSSKQCAHWLITSDSYSSV